MPKEVLDAVDATDEEIAALELNPAWDSLGLFSDDALRIIEAATIDRGVNTYAFGDDPDGSPVFVPEDAKPVGSDAMYWHLPEDWTPPEEGWCADMAFLRRGPGSPHNEGVVVEGDCLSRCVECG